jgi:hypothetical protein
VTNGRDAEPFEQTTRPAAYVPRPETEQLLDHLQTWALGGSTASIQLIGAAGMGKSLLLRVLAMRIAGQPATVHVPYPNLMPDDLATWVIEAIGEQRGRDSQAQLVAAAKQRAASGGLLLLIDDAERLPTQTRDALDLWFQRSEGSLRSVRAAVSDSAAAVHANHHERGVAEPALTHELDVEESTALLTAAMDRADLHGPLRARFNHAVMLKLHDRARGVPARLLTEAARLYQEWNAGAAPPMPTLAGEEPSRAPTQRALAQLELALAAKPAPPAEQPAHSSRESQSSHSKRATPQRDAEQFARGPWESQSSHSERADLHPPHQPAPLLDLPSQPPPRPVASARSRVALRWLAAAGAGALLGAVASTLLPTTRDGDATVADTPATLTEPPPVSAAPAPVTPPVAPATQPVDAGIGSIEFLEVVPAAPEPALVRTPAHTPTEIEPPADAGNVVVEGVIESGEWLASSFRRRRIPSELASLIAREMGNAYDFRFSQPGDRYRVTLARDGELIAFDYEAAENNRLQLTLSEGRYRLQRSLSE